MKNKLYRQGDVLIERIAEIPNTAVKQRALKQIVLAQGEATGHHHALEVRDPADWWKTEGLGVVGGEIFLSLPVGGIVTHQEHAKITLPSGKYRVTRQREYSPGELRNVAD